MDPSATSPAAPAARREARHATITEWLAIAEEKRAELIVLLVAGRDEAVRAAPFDAVEIPVAEIFGDDEEAEE